MKKIALTLMACFAVALTGCDSNTDGSFLSDPGGGEVPGGSTPSQEASALKNTLTSAPFGWKMVYEGKSFFFDFGTDNLARSISSDYPDPAAYSPYSVMDDAGNLQIRFGTSTLISILGSDLNETVLNVSSASSTKISATGNKNSRQMDLVPATEAERAWEKEVDFWNWISEAKLMYGVVKSAGGVFAFHYSLDFTSKTVNLTWIDDSGNAQHLTSDVDVNSSLTLMSWPAAGGAAVKFSGLAYANQTFTPAGDNIARYTLSPGLTPAEVKLFYLHSNYGGTSPQYIVQPGGSNGSWHSSVDAIWGGTGQISAVEINGTWSESPIVAVTGLKYLFKLHLADENKEPVVAITNDRAVFTFGGYYNADWTASSEDIPLIETDLEPLKAIWYDTDGVIVIREESGGAVYYWTIRSKGEGWLKWKKK